MAAKNPKHPRLNHLEKLPDFIPHPPFLAYLWWLLLLYTLLLSESMSSWKKLLHR